MIKILSVKATLSIAMTVAIKSQEHMPSSEIKLDDPDGDKLEIVHRGESAQETWESESMQRRKSHREQSFSFRKVARICARADPHFHETAQAGHTDGALRLWRLWRPGGRLRGDTQAEAVHHEQELARASAYLLKAIPGIEMQGYFVDFDGIWDAGTDATGTLKDESVA